MKKRINPAANENLTQLQMFITYIINLLVKKNVSLSLKRLIEILIQMRKRHV